MMRRFLSRIFGDDGLLVLWIDLAALRAERNLLRERILDLKEERGYLEQEICDRRRDAFGLERDNRSTGSNAPNRVD